MPRNRLGMKHFPSKLKPGQSTIIGPFRTPMVASGYISRLRRKMTGDPQFTQRQMLLVDPKTLETFRVYLVTRTE
jgi:hypothetical protein